MGNLGNFSLECWILNTLWPGRGEKDPKARKREKQKIEHIKNDLVVGGFPILVIFFGDKNNCHVNNLSSSKERRREKLETGQKEETETAAKGKRMRLGKETGISSTIRLVPLYCIMLPLIGLLLSAGVFAFVWSGFLSSSSMLFSFLIK